MKFPWDRKEGWNVISETQFPDQSLKIGVRDINELDSYATSLSNHEDIWRLMLLNDILVRVGKKIPLNINYLMYQQDDRIFNRNESFGLQILANVLNGLKGLSSITVFDPHSDVVHLIENVKIREATYCIKNVINQIGIGDLCILTPDAGAYKKYMPQIDTEIPVYTCSKVRDNQGNVTSVVPTDIKENKILIVDDIGLGCKTHINVAQNLHKDKERFLYVSHGVFPNGVEHLKEHFKNVYTTNSITKEKETNFLKIIEL